MSQRPKQQQTRRRQASGFTIIELLIATIIFAVIMILVTFCILQFSRQYYKGVVSSGTQGAARSLVDDIARSIQFNGGGLTELKNGSGVVNGYCVGDNKRYSFVIGAQVSTSPTLATDQTRHALVSDTGNGCGTVGGALDVTSLPLNLESVAPALKNPRELLGNNMRLAKFSITATNELYTINVRVVYGDKELLTTTTGDNANCLSNAGSQYCAASELTTTIKKRVD